MMNKKKILVGCSLAGGVFLLILAVGGFVAYRYFVSPFLLSWMVMPKELANPRAIMGSALFSKKVFFQDSRLGVISDIVYGELDPSPGYEIGIAGAKGAVFLDLDSTVRSLVLFSVPADHVDILDVNFDGICEFMNRGSWSLDASLIDHQGNKIWSYGGGSGIDDMSSGDIDGDGTTEFAVGFNGGDGVHLLDESGKKIWNKSDGNVWHIELVDANRNGKLVIVHSNAAGQLTVRDRQGDIISRAKTAPYFSDFSICRWPTKKDREYALLAEDDTIWLFDFDGKSVKQYLAPNCGSLGEVKGTAFSTGGEGSEYFAVIVNLRNWKRSNLYIYDSSGELKYHEILPEASAAITAFSLDSTDQEALLVGGDGRVWKYRIMNREISR